MAGQISSAAAPTSKPAPLIADASRDEGRTNPRDNVVRLRPREPHEKYTVEARQVTRGMDTMWVATKIRGAPSPRLGEFVRAGWRPARAADFPELSDYQLYDQSLIDMGVVPQVNADSPVIRDDQMLVIRPKALSAEALKESQAAAQQQIDDHLRRIREKSDREIGAQRTRIQRTYGPNDIVPDDDEVEA